MLGLIDSFHVNRHTTSAEVVSVSVSVLAGPVMVTTAIRIEGGRNLKSTGHPETNVVIDGGWWWANVT